MNDTNFKEMSLIEHITELRKRLLWSFVYIILIFIVLLMSKYLIRDKISFYLMTPYFLWSSYALILNSSIFILN